MNKSPAELDWNHTSDASHTCTSWSQTPRYYCSPRLQGQGGLLYAWAAASVAASAAGAAPGSRWSASEPGRPKAPAGSSGTPAGSWTEDTRRH